MIIKRRQFLWYVAFGAAALFFLYELNAYYAERFDAAELEAAAGFRTGAAPPPDPFPQGKPDFRKKKQQKQQEEAERQARERTKKMKKLADEEKRKKKKDDDDKADKKTAPKKPADAKDALKAKKDQYPGHDKLRL